MWILWKSGLSPVIKPIHVVDKLCIGKGELSTFIHIGSILCGQIKYRFNLSTGVN